MNKIKRILLTIFASFLTLCLASVLFFFLAPTVTLITYNVLANKENNVSINQDTLNMLNYTVINDISYSDINSFDIYEPLDENKLRPTIILVYSTNFIFGNKSDLINFAPFYANQGFNVIATDFTRGVSKSGVAIKELHELSNYVINNSQELKIDLNNIFILGIDTGATISSQFVGSLYVDNYLEIVENKSDLTIKGVMLFYGREELKPFNEVRQITDLLQERTYWHYYNKRKWQKSDSYLLNYNLENFPETYITESTNYQYFKEGAALSKKLFNETIYTPYLTNSKDLPYNYYFYLDNTESIGKDARNNFDLSVTFLKKLIN